MSTKNTPAVGMEDQLATGEQVGHIQDLGAKLLRALPREHAQAIITNGGVFQAAFGKMINQVLGDVTGMIVRRVKVNRSLTPQQALDATNRVQHKNDKVVATIPHGVGEDVEMTYFYVGRQLSDTELAAEYERRGLVPDQEAQAADNSADPAFADSHPNGTHWELPNGGWGFLAFNRWDDGRRVRVGRSGVLDWGGSWWFGGRRK